MGRKTIIAVLVGIVLAGGLAAGLLVSFLGGPPYRIGVQSVSDLAGDGTVLCTAGEHCTAPSNWRPEVVDFTITAGKPIVAPICSATIRVGSKSFGPAAAPDPTPAGTVTGTTATVWVEEAIFSDGPGRSLPRSAATIACR